LGLSRLTAGHCASIAADPHGTLAADCLTLVIALIAWASPLSLEGNAPPLPQIHMTRWPLIA